MTQKDVDDLVRVVGKLTNALNRIGDSVDRGQKETAKQIKALRKEVADMSRPVLPPAQNTWVIPDWNQQEREPTDD